MSDDKSKKYKLSLTEKSEKILNLVKNKIEGSDPDPIGMIGVNDNDIEVAASLLNNNKELYAYINMLVDIPEAVKEIETNENNLRYLKKIGLIDYSVANEQNQEKEDNERENPNLEKQHEEIENPDVVEDTSKDIDKPKDEPIPNEQDKQEEKEEPTNIEDVVQGNEETKKSPEYLAFTKERLINQVNDMQIPEYMKKPIREAYDKMVYVNELQDQNFLKKYLENNDEAKKAGIDPNSFGNMHQSILMNTYVGYVMDNNAEVADDGSKVAVVEFPQTIEDMPQWMKSSVNEEIVNQMKKSIDRVMSNGNSYDALIMIIPIDRMYDRALELTEYDSDKGGNADLKRAYIKYLKEDSKNNLKEEFRTGTQDLDVRINAADVDWTNPRVRKEMINLVNRAEKEAYNQHIENLVQNVSFSIVVHSKSDVEDLKDMCKDLKGLNVTKSVSVVVETDDPKERAELSKEVDSTISKDKEVKNDTYREDHVADQVLTSAITASAVSLGMLGMLQQEGQSQGQEQEPSLAKNPLLSNAEKMSIMMTDAMKNEKLMNEVAMQGDNPVEYMAALTQEMLEVEEEEQAREMYYRDLGYDDSNAN